MNAARRLFSLPRRYEEARERLLSVISSYYKLYDKWEEAVSCCVNLFLDHHRLRAFYVELFRHNERMGEDNDRLRWIVRFQRRIIDDLERRVVILEAAGKRRIRAKS